MPSLCFMVPIQLSTHPGPVPVYGWLYFDGILAGHELAVEGLLHEPAEGALPHHTLPKLHQLHNLVYAKILEKLNKNPRNLFIISMNLNFLSLP